LLRTFYIFGKIIKHYGIKVPTEVVTN